MPDGARYPNRWVAPSDHRAAETRLLEPVAEIGDANAPNLLIRGDALHALKALMGRGAAPVNLTGSVRLAYLDPPFGTGQTFHDYEDNLERSVCVESRGLRLPRFRSRATPSGTCGAGPKVRLGRLTAMGSV